MNTFIKEIKAPIASEEFPMEEKYQIIFTPDNNSPVEVEDDLEEPSTAQLLAPEESDDEQASCIQADVDVPKAKPAAQWNKLRTALTMTSAMSQISKSKKRHHPMERQDSFILKFTTQRGGIDEEVTGGGGGVDTSVFRRIERKTGKKFSLDCVVDPQGTTVVGWLAVVTMAVLYNLWTCIARQAFLEIRVGYEVLWFFFDGLSDLIYLLDILVQLRTSYLERGLTVRDNKKLADRYVKSKYFFIDLLCLVPFDFFQFLIGVQPMVRFPRFFKAYRAWRWKVIVENRTVFPNAWRVINLTHILFLGCHWFAAFYFMISKAGNYNSTWGYPEPKGEYASVTRKYLKSLYWSTLTLTTIGDLPAPERNWEYVFTIVSYLIGVFVFAMIVGQIGNVITNRNAQRLEFEKILDNAKNYMRMHSVPKELQKRVMRWYDYAWSRGRTNGGGDINALGLLPDKLKTEMALHVNLETLKKVTIFQECRPEFLHDLVLKMRPYIFTPGDLICRKGEVAREMFIIADGVLEVISDSGDVLTTMGSGDFFGEIGILNLDGGINRRTADVKSVGYAELFVLSKEDVLTALKDHPDAEELIIRYGTRRLNEIKDRRLQKSEDLKKSHMAVPYTMLPGLGNRNLMRLDEPTPSKSGNIRSLLGKLKSGGRSEPTINSTTRNTSSSASTKARSRLAEIWHVSSASTVKSPESKPTMDESKPPLLPTSGLSYATENVTTMNLCAVDDCLRNTNNTRPKSVALGYMSNEDDNETLMLSPVLCKPSPSYEPFDSSIRGSPSPLHYQGFPNPTVKPKPLPTSERLQIPFGNSAFQMGSTSTRSTNQNKRHSMDMWEPGFQDNSQRSGNLFRCLPQNSYTSPGDTATVCQHLGSSQHLPADSIEALLKCVNEMVALRTKELDSMYAIKIRQLEDESLRKEDKIKELERQLRLNDTEDEPNSNRESIFLGDMEYEQIYRLSNKEQQIGENNGGIIIHNDSAMEPGVQDVTTKVPGVSSGGGLISEQHQSSRTSHASTAPSNFRELSAFPSSSLSPPHSTQSKATDQAYWSPVLHL